ncbi:Alpha/Beta hydrolase protein [Umbelopsis sp. PMI_123]|nr:Alpha/Beta hydrolase protein [Umbelopsis sp. PMI_123]
MDNIQLKTDTRFTYSYRLHCSPGKESESFQLLIAIHGNERDVQGLVKAFERNVQNLSPGNYALLFPLFPVGVLGDDNEQGYKFLRENDIRYDKLLFDMVHQLCHDNLHLDHDISTFLLYGYSGGGQFVHRLFYLYPERIRALFVGAPGAITLLGDEHHWWFGTRNIKKTFGLQGDLDLNTMKKVPTLMAVGDKDIKDVAYSQKVKDKLFAAVGGDQEALLSMMGRNRVERIQILYKNWEQAGLRVKLQIIPGLGHHGISVVRNAIDFFASL